MPTPAPDVEHVPSRPAEHRPHATRPIVRMIDGTGLGVHARSGSAIPPTQYTFCFCSCFPPPLDGSPVDGPGKA